MKGCCVIEHEGAPPVCPMNGQVGLLYGAWGLPVTYLIDPSGTAIARAWGPADWDSPGARQLIAELLKTKP